MTRTPTLEAGTGNLLRIGSPFGAFKVRSS
jgi:hypothetical protein